MSVDLWHFPWLSLILLGISLYGIWNHILGLLEARRDEHAARARKVNGAVLREARSEVQEESWRLLIKCMFAGLYTLATYSNRSMLEYPDSTGLLAFGLQVGILLALSAESRGRRLVRQQAMVRQIANRPPRPCVLLVEDDTRTRELVVEVLESDGF